MTSAKGEGMSRPRASIVVPAHNEASVIGPMLDALIGDNPGRYEVIVVCNGCNDDTAAVARRYDTAVTVIEIEEPSKQNALMRGDEAAERFPRLYVDADVEVSASSVDALVDALLDPMLLAAAPARRIPRDGISKWVAWYYDVWERLPQVKAGLFGRGVIALTAEGNERVRSLPPLMGDDLLASEAFEPWERAIVGSATVTIWPPRKLADLLRRRTRAMTGNAEADRLGLRRPTSATSWRNLGRLAVAEPTLVPKIFVFVSVAVVARVRSQRRLRSGDTTLWLRDDSSRVRSDISVNVSDPSDGSPPNL